MPLKLKEVGKSKKVKQEHVDKLCPFMSRRITHPAYIDGQNCGHAEELVRQPCVGDDCAVWDAKWSCCGLRAKT